MKKTNEKLLMLSLFLTPALFSKIDNTFVSVFLMGIFLTLHAYKLILKPLLEISPWNKGILIALFVIRIILVFNGPLMMGVGFAIVDYMLILFLSCVFVPIAVSIKRNKRANQIVNNSNVVTNVKKISGIELRCAKCNSLLEITDNFCTNCGAPFDKNNVVVSENANASINIPEKTSVLPMNFDKIYSLPEDKMLEEFINKELVKLGVDKNLKLIPKDALKRKKIFNLIFSFLVFVFITLFFFHFPIYTYLIGIVLLFIFYKATTNYNLIKYLKKELVSRPNEKISNILMNVKNTFVVDNSKLLFLGSLLISIILPLVIFINPKILYEKVDGGYAVRYYAFGLTNFKSVTIPETYKNEKIVSLRGNTFSNMFFLKSVKLPDTITEIRGQAFKNCKKLTDVNIPTSLEYLGGGAFYNAVSIKRIELPDTLTYLGGEAFYGASSLEYIKLSNNLTEIRGDSFEYCDSLEKITIPDSVIRIGGHAFYGDTSLSEVLISEDSKLEEIGSSAFRQCSSLYSIKIPSKTSVNERAFKESPTTIKRYDNYPKEDAIYNDDVTNITIDDDGNFESDYIVLETNKNKVFSINNNQNILKYSVKLTEDKFAIYINGDVSNYTNTKLFDIEIEYYDKDYNKIAKCDDMDMFPTNLEGKPNKWFSCYVFKPNVERKLDDIKYYKIYLENFYVEK